MEGVSGKSFLIVTTSLGVVVAVNRPLFSLRIPIKNNVLSTSFDANSCSNDRSMILQTLLCYLLLWLSRLIILLDRSGTAAHHLNN